MTQIVTSIRDDNAVPQIPTHLYLHIVHIYIYTHTHTNLLELQANEVYIVTGVICALILTLILILCVCIFCILCYHYHRESLYDDPDDPRYVASPLSAPHSRRHPDESDIDLSMNPAYKAPCVQHTINHVFYFQ